MNTQPSLVSAEDFGRVAVLMGGWSAEREISLKSGNAVLAALQRCGVNAQGIDVGRDIFQALSGGHFDRAFVALHGRGGEDGVVQALLELLQLPYTGSGVMASALAMNKLATKRLLEGTGLPTPAYVVLDENSDWSAVNELLAGKAMVKPVHEGSSIGIAKAESADQLVAAWEEARRYDDVVIAERWIDGREYTAAILGHQALPLIRLETPRTFYDYEAKYFAEDTRYHCPCGLPAAEEQTLQRIALQAFAAVEAQGWGRVDLFVDQKGQPWVIEINTVPGLTDHSLVPMAARAADMSFDQLVWQILAQTVPTRVGASADDGERSNAR